MLNLVELIEHINREIDEHKNSMQQIEQTDEASKSYFQGKINQCRDLKSFIEKRTLIGASYQSIN
jgi:hypothetical protein